jgi:hypothetical protein
MTTTTNSGQMDLAKSMTTLAKLVRSASSRDEHQEITRLRGAIVAIEVGDYQRAARMARAAAEVLEATARG